MSDNEIIKVLECCANSDGCEDCPCSKKCDGVEHITNAIDLINRQKAEIDRLQSMNQAKLDMIHDLMAEIESLKGSKSTSKSFEDYMGGKVTHWMPMPAPPEKTKKTDKRDDSDCTKCRDFMRCEPPMWPCKRFDPIDEQEENK